MPPTSEESLNKEKQVLNLRRGGLTFDLIAQRVGYGNPSSAAQAYRRALKRIVYEEVESVRKVESDRLDLAQSAIWQGVTQGDIPSINTLLRIMQRRAALLGLDMPVKVQQEVTVHNGDSDLDREIQSLIKRLAGNDSDENVLADGEGETRAVTPSGGVD